LFLLNLALVIGLTLATGQADKQAHGKEETHLTWDTGYWQEESRDLQQVPWYQNYRWLSVVLVVLSIGVVVAFW
jgi:SSS family solute:Na+ symporter